MNLESDKMTNRQGYKKTELGWIPEEWGVVMLGNIVKITMGQSPLSIFYNDKGYGLPLIQGNADVFNRKTVARVFTTSVTKKCYAGDIIMSVRAPVGKISKAMFEACIGRGVCSIANVSDYLYQYFIFIEDQWKKKSQGSTFDSVSSQVIKSIFIPLPPLPEQTKIAEILSCWDRAIEKMEKLIKLKTQLKKGLMQQLLTGKKRFREFGDKWKNTKLNEFLIMNLRPVVKPAEMFRSIGIRSFGKGTFEKKISKPESIMMDILYRVEENDLIVSITFAWEGAIAIVRKEDEGSLVSHRFPTYIFDREKVLVEFFRQVMVTDRFIKQLQLISPGGAGRNRVLNKNDFLNLSVNLPLIPEQMKIGGILCHIDKEIAILTGALKNIKRQKQGLMQKLLTGQIRVKY